MTAINSAGLVVPRTRTTRGRSRPGRFRVAGIGMALAGLLASSTLTVPDTAAAQPEVVRVSVLETNAAVAPLGIDDAEPRLSWRLAADRRAVMQSAYQVLVATAPELLQPGKADLWDSGTVASADPWADYDGRSLVSRTRYYWSVRVWDEQDAATAWAPATWFETAFLDASEWEAEWIAGPVFTPPASCSQSGTARMPCTAPAPLLRKDFRVARDVARARLYASGLGYGTYWINGTRVGDEVLGPGFTDYTRRVFYVTHDVTAMLRQGDNAIGAMLGRGPYGAKTPNNVNYEKAPWHHEPQLRAELHITYTDGTSDVVGTDSTWRTTNGPIRHDDFVVGETYDARRAAELGGWSRAGYDATSWPEATKTSTPAGRLVAQNLEPVRPIERLRFSKVTSPAPGSYVFHLPDNIAGNAVLDLDVPTGKTITLHYGEKLTPEGHVEDYVLRDAPDVFQLDEYTGGPGIDRWRPEFTYKGFQYVEVTGLGERPPLDALQAEVWHNDVRPTGSWQSSNDLANLIVKATRRSVLSNLVDQPTDTPIYEKTGYTADGQLMVPSNSYLLDLRRFYAKWLIDIQDAQSTYGELPEHAPSALDHNSAPGTYTNDVAGVPGLAFPGPSPGWDAALFTVGDDLHRYWGDERPVQGALPEMKKYAEFVLSVAPQGVIPGVCAQPFYFPCANGLGDWSGPTGEPHGPQLDSTAWYYQMLRILRETAQRAGEATTVAVTDARRAQVAAAFTAAFRDPATGTYRDLSDRPDIFSQHQNAIALALGLVSPGDAQTVSDAIANDVAARGNHLFTGIMGTRFLWHALTAHGHLDAAWAVATQTSYPSYGYWLKELGWPTLGENWEENTRSRNHHMFGTIVQWLFEDIAGYQPAKPGFAEIEFKPYVPTNGLDWVRASTDTVRGTVASSWRKTSGGFELDVTVPPNSTGLVYFPGTDPQHIAETGQGWAAQASTADGVELVGVQGDRVVYRVGSGTYKFRTVDASLPDLTVTDVSASQDKPKQTVLTATVANRGGGDADGVVVEFRDGETVLGRTAPVSVAKDGSAAVSLTWDTRAVKGDHVITAVVDPANTVAESDERNNTASRTVTIRGNKVDNGSFESSSDGAKPDGWSGSGSSTSYDRSGAHASDGKAALGVTGGGSVTSGPAWTSSPIDVTPGHAYDLAMTVATTESPSPPSLSVSYLDSAGTVVGTAIGIATALTGDTAAKDVIGHIVIPSGVSQVRLNLTGFAAGDAGPQGTVWFDDIWMG